MKFRTEYEAPRGAEPLDPTRPVVLLGSCFSDSVGAKMGECGWPVSPNPCGVLYNPLSIASAISLALDAESRDTLIEESLICRQAAGAAPVWLSWLCDSKAHGSSKAEACRAVSARAGALRDAIVTAQAAVVTFGTAWVYTLAPSTIGTGKSHPEEAAMQEYVVANCHKFPERTFLRRLLTADEIVSTWAAVITHMRCVNPNLRIIFTISPIRHLRDGFAGNSLSKATLRLGVAKLCAEVAGTEYFPAFEILTDDLRDYRFYASDMLHPSPQAVDYIWEKFLDTYVDAKGRALLAAGLKRTKAVAHRPLITR